MEAERPTKKQKMEEQPSSSTTTTITSSIPNPSSELTLNRALKDLPAGVKLIMFDFIMSLKANQFQAFKDTIAKQMDEVYEHNPNEDPEHNGNKFILHDLRNDALSFKSDDDYNPVKIAREVETDLDKMNLPPSVRCHYELYKLVVEHWAEGGPIELNKYAWKLRDVNDEFEAIVFSICDCDGINWEGLYDPNTFQEIHACGIDYYLEDVPDDMDMTYLGNIIKRWYQQIWDETYCEENVLEDPESEAAKKYFRLKKELEEDGARDDFDAIRLTLLKEAKKE